MITSEYFSFSKKGILYNISGLLSSHLCCETLSVSGTTVSPNNEYKHFGHVTQ